ncbi:ATP12-domain-containing protein [Testicularia cyperi]|uniref:ATP12-domain-containing protein n=1 Tax=Testicularia cyperi TaxID=1882483 RepID=A0A317XTV5_9BASI|nr:ATP12-domain-containing protein [Testicularia cyperi]
MLAAYGTTRSALRSALRISSPRSLVAPLSLAGRASAISAGVHAPVLGGGSSRSSRRQFSITRTVFDDEAALNRAERLKRRFWKNVTLEEQPSAGGFKICLDGRAIRSPGGGEIVIPSERKLLAAAIAHEWQEQGNQLKPHTLPLTSLAARALEGCSNPQDRAQIESDLLRYLENETVCFQESQPTALVQLQDEHWTPLISHINSTFDVDIEPFQGLLGNSHSDKVMQTFKSHLEALDSFDLAAFERSVMISKSFLISVALIQGHLDVEKACQAAQVEVQSQINRWGEVEDSHDVDHADLRRTLGSVAIATVRS